MKYLSILILWFVFTNYDIGYKSPGFYLKSDCVSAKKTVLKKYRSKYKKYYKEIRAWCKNLDSTNEKFYRQKYQRRY